MRNCHHQWKIGENFEMKRRIKIRRHGFVGKLSDNNLAKFQPGAADLEFKNACTTRPKFSCRERKRNIPTPHHRKKI